jgi:hypothetical protein
MDLNWMSRAAPKRPEAGRERRMIRVRMFMTERVFAPFPGDRRGKVFHSSADHSRTQERTISPAKKCE